MCMLRRTSLGTKLSERVLRWLEGVSFLGPFELTTSAHQAEENWVFEISMSGTPVEFANEAAQISISPTTTGESLVSGRVVEDGRKIFPYFETFGENVIASRSVLDINLEASCYSSACFLANYANVRSNMAFFKVLRGSKQALSVEVSSFTSLFSGGTDDDFHNVLYSCVDSSYRYWELFSYLSDSRTSPDAAIEQFEDNPSSL